MAYPRFVDQGDGRRRGHVKGGMLMLRRHVSGDNIELAHVRSSENS